MNLAKSMVVVPAIAVAALAVGWAVRSTAARPVMVDGATGRTVYMEVCQPVPGGGTTSGFLTLSQGLVVCNEGNETVQRVLSYYVEWQTGHGKVIYKAAQPMDADSSAMSTNVGPKIMTQDLATLVDCGFTVAPRPGLVWRDVASEEDIVFQVTMDCY